GPEADLPAGPVVQGDLAVRRLEAGAQLRGAAALPLQGGQGELDVLAGGGGGGGGGGAGAMVVARRLAAGVDTGGALRLRVADLELGDDALVAEVPELELLLTAELAPQLDLPVLERHARRLLQPRQLDRLALLAGGPGPARLGGHGRAGRSGGRFLPPRHGRV